MFDRKKDSAAAPVADRFDYSDLPYLLTEYDDTEPCDQLLTAYNRRERLSDELDALQRRLSATDTEINELEEDLLATANEEEWVG